MSNFGSKLHLACFALLLLTLVSTTMAQEPPANVAGDWTIHSRGPDGRERTQFMHINQQGGVITGHYQGPGQHGQLEGTINQQHILFRTKTHAVLTFRGRVDGPRTDHVVQGRTISGTYRDEHGEGHWNAVRAE
ncbi:MAG: hypothetical protein WCA15_22015 [Candidatus Acidiferrales bacterium]